MWAWYNAILHRYPVPTEMATSATLWLSGDVLAQMLESKYVGHEKKRKKHSSTVVEGEQHKQKTKNESTERQGQQAQAIHKFDWHRTGVQTVYAGLIWAPIGHYWYEWLDRTATSLAPAGTGMRFVATKLALEVVLLHPVALFAFFTCVGLMSGEKPREIAQQLRADFFPSLMLEYMLWTPIDVVVFSVVPVRHQLLVVNTVCLLESIMLSYIKSNGVALPGSHGGDQNKEINKKKAD